MEKHFILVVWNNIATKLAFHFPYLFISIKYHGLHMFRLPSIKKTKNIGLNNIIRYLTIRSDSTFRALIEIQHQLWMQYDDLKFEHP
jgi:hypothetical protein